MLDALRAFVVVGLVAACGSVKGRTPDAQDIDAAPAVVKVTALSLIGDGLPDTTAKVVFQDPEGNVILDAAVDAMGHAQAMLPSGGTVSAIRITNDTPTSLVATMETVVGVQGGDDLTLGLKRLATITNQGGQTSMTATFTPLANATSYGFYTSCGAVFVSASPVTLNFRDSCHGQSFDLLATATGAMLATPAFLKLTNISYEGGGSFNIPVGFTTMSNFTVNMTNIADAVSNLSITRFSLIGNTPVAPQGVSAGDPPAGSLSQTVLFPQGFGTRSEVAVSTSRMGAQNNQRHEVHTATLSPSLNVDLGKQLPWFTDVAITQTGGTWTMVAPGDPPDGMQTTWFGRWVVGTRNVSISWRIVQPAAMAGMTLPHLPPAYAMIDPGQQTVPVTAALMTVTMAELDNVAGYDEFRQMGETLITSIGSMGAFLGMPLQRRTSSMIAQ